MRQVGYLGLRVVVLGLVFVLANAILWWPWVQETMFGDPKHGVASVISRIFPVRRGLFEDKVASFWCVLNNFVKVHKIFTQSQ
jgi:alpha-1,3-glucosyltransferase